MSKTVLSRIVSKHDGCANISPFAGLGRVPEVVVMAKVPASSRAAARRKFKISWVACPNHVENIQERISNELTEKE
jgi:hypothetical protein